MIFDHLSWKNTVAWPQEPNRFFLNCLKIFHILYFCVFEILVSNFLLDFFLECFENFRVGVDIIYKGHEEPRGSIHPSNEKGLQLIFQPLNFKLCVFHFKILNGRNNVIGNIVLFLSLYPSPFFVYPFLGIASAPIVKQFHLFFEYPILFS